MRLAFMAPRGVALLLLLAVTVHADEPAGVDFNRQIRPILSESCYQCHGPDQNKRKADLRLDRREGLFRSADGTTVVVPGKPEESELFFADHVRLIPTCGCRRPRAEARLKPEQIELIKRWIEEGAAVERALGLYSAGTTRGPPQRPDRSRPPARSTGSSARGCAANGLEPSPPADRSDLDPPAQLRPDRACPRRPREVDAVRERQEARRLRAAGRPAACFASFRRADGDLLARPGALRRHDRLPRRQSRRYLPLSRLRDPIVQRQQAV